MDRDARERLRQRFNEQWGRWGGEAMHLPPEAMEPDAVWIIVHRGWTIWARFGEEEGREYLDYYASHRMTDDSHVRMFADGKAVGLPTIETMMFGFPSDGTPEEKKAAEEVFYARNRDVQRMLEEKGFRMTGQAHPSAQINRYLATNPDAHKRTASGDDTPEGGETP